MLLIALNEFDAPFKPLLLMSLLAKPSTVLMLSRLKQLRVSVSFWRPKSKFFAIARSMRLTAGKRLVPAFSNCSVP